MTHPLEDCNVCGEPEMSLTKCGGVDKTGCENRACDFCLEYIWDRCSECGEKFCDECLTDGKCKECIGVE